MNFGHDTEGNYTGERHIATAWRIRSVYGAEYAGGYTGFMEAADTASTGNISLLGGVVKVDNLLDALKVVYPTETNTAVYGPLKNLDSVTWNKWVRKVAKYGGYGLEIIRKLSEDENFEFTEDAKYYYGCNVVAGRNAVFEKVGDQKKYPKTEGGDAGGYVGLMRSGVITNGQSYDMKEIRAMRAAGGYAGSMQTGGLVDVGEAGVSLLGLDINADLGKLVSAVGDAFVPAIQTGSVSGWQSGMTVTAAGAPAIEQSEENNIIINGLRSVDAECSIRRSTRTTTALYRIPAPKRIPVSRPSTSPFRRSGKTITTRTVRVRTRSRWSSIVRHMTKTV